MRTCESIGMVTIDRARCSCTHATPWCAAHCYNRKIYRTYPATMAGAEQRLEGEWRALTGEQLHAELARKQTAVTRLRLMSRGEAFSEPSDVAKVGDLAAANPSVQFWVPTRAWFSARKGQANWDYIAKLEALSRQYPNLLIHASVDPSHPQWAIQMIVGRGWSTMSTGNDQAELVPGSVKCPKTWEHTTGSCATCDICFSRAQHHAWLKQH
jgi:hypothetical protein